MSNLLSAEWYKLKKDLNFRLMAALTVFFVIFQYGANTIIEAVLRRDGAVGEQAERMEQLANIEILDMMHSMFGNTNAIIFVTIFACCFVLNDYNSGMISNFVGKGYRRSSVFFAKFLVIQCGAVMLYLLTALVTLLAGIIVYGTEEINAAFFHDFGTYLFLHLLFLTAYNAVIVLACTLIRTMAAGILGSILGVMLFSNLIMQGIDLLLSYLGIEDGVSQYWIVTIIARCPVRDIPAHDLTVSVIAAVFWLAVSAGAGLLLFEKRDVR